MYFCHRTSPTASGRALPLHPHPPASLTSIASIVVYMHVARLVGDYCLIILMYCVHMQVLLGLPRSSVNSKVAAGTLLMLAVFFVCSA